MIPFKYDEQLEAAKNSRFSSELPCYINESSGNKYHDEKDISERVTPVFCITGIKQRSYELNIKVLHKENVQICSVDIRISTAVKSFTGISVPNDLKAITINERGLMAKATLQNPDAMPVFEVGSSVGGYKICFKESEYFILCDYGSAMLVLGPIPLNDAEFKHLTKRLRKEAWQYK